MNETTERSDARWAVVNRVMGPPPGNGVWSWHRTRLGALWARDRLLRFKVHGGYYVLPAGGLDVRRVSDGEVVR